MKCTKCKKDVLGTKDYLHSANQDFTACRTCGTVLKDRYTGEIGYIIKELIIK